MMPRLRRLQLIVWCLLFPLLGTGLPREAVWQCAHAAQIITLLPASPSAMPCRMAHQTMACCRTASPETPQRASLHAPPCKPTVTPATAAPVARLTAAFALLIAADASPADFPQARPLLPGSLTVTASAPRGPPPLPLASLTHASAHGLRAPPLS